MKLSSPKEHGFTLIEMMVVVVILAGVALLAVPALTRDNLEAQLNKYVDQFARDVQRAHMEAISSREDRSIRILATQYVLGAVSGTSFFDLYPREAPNEVVTTDVKTIAAVPWNSGYSAGSVNTSPLGSEKEIRFLGSGGIAFGAGAAPNASLTSSSVTVFFKSANDTYHARVVIYQSTSFSKIYKGW